MSLMPVWEEQCGDVLLRILREKSGYKGGVIRPGQKPDVYRDDDLARLQSILRREAGRSGRDYVGFDGARQKFLEHYPDGFAGPDFHGDNRTGERRYSHLCPSTLPFQATTRCPTPN